MRSPRLTSALSVLLLATASGCATVQNYLDPSGPVLAGTVTREPAPPPATLRLVTFNIEEGRRVREAIELLRTHPDLREADVITLQEMDGAGVAAIGEALHLSWVYVPAARDPESGRDIGTAVLSRWPIEERWKVPLPHLTRVIHRSRAATAVRLRIGEEVVRVYSVHLGSPIGLSPGKRRAQAEAVMADAAASLEPVVIAGDFNSSKLGGRFEERGYTWVTRGIGRTVRRFSFDHVFVRGLAPAGSPAGGVAREASGASDHRPVWARLRLAP